MEGGSDDNLFDCGPEGTHAVVLDYNPAQGDTLAGSCKMVNKVSSSNAAATPNVNSNSLGLQPNGG